MNRTLEFPVSIPEENQPKVKFVSTVTEINYEQNAKIILQWLYDGVPGGTADLLVDIIQSAPKRANGNSFAYDEYIEKFRE